MFLFQILVPIIRKDGRESFEQISSELKDKFGGVTCYSRAPAEGLWEKEQRETVKDSVVVIEVMAEDKDESWWTSYRKTLEERLSQEEVVIRAIQTEKI